MHYVFIILFSLFAPPALGQQRVDTPPSAANNAGQNIPGQGEQNTTPERNIEDSPLFKLGKPMGNSPLRPREMEVGDFNDSMSVRELPTDQPGMTPMEMRGFVSLVLPRIMSMDHTRIRDDLREIRQYFTEAGWNDYMSTLDRAGVVDSLRDNQMDMTALVQSDPVVEDKGILQQDRYFWDISADLMVTYRNVRRSSNFTMTVLPRFIRVPAAKAPTINDPTTQAEIQRAMKIGVLIDAWRLQVN
jgi:hypothetical protein